MIFTFAEFKKTIGIIIQCHYLIVSMNMGCTKRSLLEESMADDPLSREVDN